jgi:hypothetical protein
MSAVTTFTTDMLAGPVLIIRPGLQSQTIKRGQNDFNLAVRMGEPATAATPATQCNLTITTTGAVVDLLDDANATWEDAEWQ